MSYTSREPYGAQPTPLTARGPDPRAASLVADTLAQNLAEVSGKYMGLWAAAKQADVVSSASGITAKLSMTLAEGQKGFDNDPNPSTVPDRFKTYAAELRAATMEGLDPAVAAHVGRVFDNQMVPTAFRQIIDVAGKRHIGNLRADDDNTAGIQAQGIAATRDGEELRQHIAGAKARIAGLIASGVYNQGDATPLLSRTLRQAITIRAAGSDAGAPLAAQAMLDRFKDEMDAGDVAALRTALRAPVERATGDEVGGRHIAVASGTASRAQAVEAGFIARGWSPAAARGLAANAVQESGANPSGAVGDGGRSSGLFQWNDSRRAAFVAKYGTDPHKATLDQQIEFADAELRGSESRAGAALAAAKTPEDAARIASTQFLRPRDTAAEETRRAGIATRLGGNAAQLATALAGVREEMKDAPLHMRLATESSVARHYSQLDHQDQQARGVLKSQLGDLVGSYSAGNTRTDPPVAEIMALFPGAVGQRMVDELSLTRSAGDAVRAGAYASPADRAATLARLSGDPASDYMSREHQHAAGVFRQAMDRANKAAADDPAGYAAGAPEVQALRAAGATVPQLAAASLAVQERLGVPVYKQRILDNARVENIAGTLRTTGPEEADMMVTLNAVAQQFGPELWNRAYGELVQHGKIGWEWQNIAAMPLASQAEGRAQMQAALVFLATPGRGEKELHEQVGSTRLKEIDPAVDAAMAKFRDAVSLHPGGNSYSATVRQGVELLTKWKMSKNANLSAGDAAADAYHDVIGARFDTAGDDRSGTFLSGQPTLLVPKGEGARIEAGLALVLGSITAADIMPLADPSQPKATQEELRAGTFALISRGFWINNADGSGAVLKARTLGGGVTGILMTTGKPIEVSFNSLPTRMERPPAKPPIPDDETPVDLLRLRSEQQMQRR